MLSERVCVSGRSKQVTSRLAVFRGKLRIFAAKVGNSGKTETREPNFRLEKHSQN